MSISRHARWMRNRNPPPRWQIRHLSKSLPDLAQPRRYQPLTSRPQAITNSCWPNSTGCRVDEAALTTAALVRLDLVHSFIASTMHKRAAFLDGVADLDERLRPGVAER
jgi:hypothetical protein